MDKPPPLEHLENDYWGLATSESYHALPAAHRTYTVLSWPFTKVRQIESGVKVLDISK